MSKAMNHAEHFGKSVQRCIFWVIFSGQSHRRIIFWVGFWRVGVNVSCLVASFCDQSNRTLVVRCFDYDSVAFFVVIELHLEIFEHQNDQDIDEDQQSFQSQSFKMILSFVRWWLNKYFVDVIATVADVVDDAAAVIDYNGDEIRCLILSKSHD